MNVSYKTIGRNIRHARISAGFTQQEAANLLHLSALHWGRIERGERPVSLERLALIAKVMNVKVSTLLCGCIPEDSFDQTTSEKSIALGNAVAKMAANCSDKTIQLLFDICKLMVEADKT